MSRSHSQSGNCRDVRRNNIAALTTCVVLGIAGHGPVHAQALGTVAAASTQPLVSEQEKHRLLAQVQALRQRASDMRQSAESRFTDTSTACYRKFLVSSCLGDAKQARIEAIQDARKLDAQASDMERDLNRRLRVNTEYERAQREEEKRKQAAQGRTERDLEVQRGAARQAERTRRMEQGGAQVARELQQHQQRDAEKVQARAARVADAHKRAEAARRQRAEIDRKIAEHAHKKAERDAMQFEAPPAQPK